MGTSCGSIACKTRNSWVRTTRVALSRFMPTLGLTLIFMSVFLFNDTTPLPTLPLIIPILGTALIIWFSGHGDWVSRILSSKLFVSIGLISYSLYLWHQPILVFYRLKSATALSAYDKIESIMISFALAIFTWWCIERFFRNKKLIHTKALWLSLAISASFIVTFMAYVYLNNGVPSRVPPLYYKKHSLDQSHGSY